MALNVLGGIDEIGMARLTSEDVVRHPLVQKIVKAYDEYEKKQENKAAKKKYVIKANDGRTRGTRNDN